MCKQLPKAQVGLRTQTPTPEGPGGSGQALLSGAQHRAGSEPPNLKLQTPLATCSPHCCFPFPAKAASLSFMFLCLARPKQASFFFLKEKHSHSEGKQTKLNSCYLIAVGSVRSVPGQGWSITQTVGSGNLYHGRAVVGSGLSTF